MFDSLSGLPGVKRPTSDEMRGLVLSLGLTCGHVFRPAEFPREIQTLGAVSLVGEK